MTRSIHNLFTIILTASIFSVAGPEEPEEGQETKQVFEVLGFQNRMLINDFATFFPLLHHFCWVTVFLFSELLHSVAGQITKNLCHNIHFMFIGGDLQVTHL